MPHEEILCPVTRITPASPYHFFGYYDKSPWDASGRYLLAMRVAFMRRPPTPDDMAVIGLIDLDRDNRWRPLAETTAWYWQQGCMLQWLPSAPDRKIIYNTRTSAGYGSTILDIETGEVLWTGPARTGWANTATRIISKSIRMVFIAASNWKSKYLGSTYYSVWARQGNGIIAPFRRAEAASANSGG